MNRKALFAVMCFYCMTATGVGQLLTAVVSIGFFVVAWTERDYAFAGAYGAVWVLMVKAGIDLFFECRKKIKEGKLKL